MRSMGYNGFFCTALILGATVFPASAQNKSTDPQVPSPPEETDSKQPLPIVVIGEQEEDRRVFAGSRLPRKPLFENGPIATSTGTRGLTPGSGIDPMGRYTRIVRKTECVAADERIGKDVACALIAAREASEKEEWSLVRGILVPIADNFELNATERRTASEFLYLSARNSGDRDAQIEALELLVGSGSLSPAKTGEALRSLSSLANRNGDRQAAQGYLTEAVRIDPEDHRALANLAILERASGDSDAADTMRRAIAAAGKAGRSVPQSWRSFVGD